MEHGTLLQNVFFIFFYNIIIIRGIIIHISIIKLCKITFLKLLLFSYINHIRKNPILSLKPKDNLNTLRIHLKSG